MPVLGPRRFSLKVLVQWFWMSRTANTWASLFTRSVSLVLVLPLVLRHFPEADVAVWFVFSAVLAVQSVLGFGFSPSFARLLSYARAGARIEDMVDLSTVKAIGAGKEADWQSIERLFGCMRRVFLLLSLVSLVFLATLGTLAVWKPIAQTGQRPDIWIAWAVIVVVSSISFWGSSYISYLQGMDYQLQWRRCETVLSLATILVSFLVLTAGGGLLALVVGNQICALVSVAIYYNLCHRLDPSHFPALGRSPWDRVAFTVVWSSAWKSGLTNIASYGLMQATGIIQAQIANPLSVATYNLQLRIATVLGQVVQAPFITKLPELARLRAAGDLPGQLRLIRRGMRLSLWTLVLATAAVGLLFPVALASLGINSVRFNLVLWALFSMNMLLERHGGMLHQIRNLTNLPKEHYAVTGYCAISTVLMVVFIKLGLEFYSFPLAWLTTQVVFSEWYAARVTYRTIGTWFLDFEKSVLLPPLALTVAFWLVALMR